MLGRVALGIFVIFLMFMFAKNINTGIRDLRTDVITNVGQVTTDSTTTTGTVTLNREIFQDSLTQVKSVASSYSGDNPIASNYVYSANTLTISGLAISQTRSITVIYYSEKQDEFWQAIGPFFSFFIFGGILAAIAWSIWDGRPKHAH